ncbi:MAG: hypothetical protein PUJ12_04575 [Oscillospiraceae bacterium]|nr:hypothetical protein [Clostridiales bacterium]MDD7674047.1 hypothetical protein [Oscillospiraceae bacterium]
MSKMDNGITRPALLARAFRRRLPGESPTLHASGFHHPALAVCAKPTQGSPITAFSYLPNSNTIMCNLQALFLFFLTNRIERGMLFLYKKE